MLLEFGERRGINTYYVLGSRLMASKVTPGASKSLAFTSHSGHVLIYKNATWASKQKPQSDLSSQTQMLENQRSDKTPLFKDMFEWRGEVVPGFFWTLEPLEDIRKEFLNTGVVPKIWGWREEPGHQEAVSLPPGRPRGGRS